MKISKLLIGIAVFILLAVLLLIYLISRSRTISIECVNCGEETGISPLGYLVFDFSKDIIPEQLDQVVEIFPNIKGNWVWLDENRLRWIADVPMHPGQEINITFSPGKIGKKEEEIRKAVNWDLNVRPASILALKSPQEGGQEVYFSEYQSNPELEQLTFTNGKVYDYAPSPSGETIIFSEENDHNGLDLWIINRDGSDLHKVLDCGESRCSSPAWSPDMEEIAYVRETGIVDLEANSKYSGVWILNLASSETTPLFEEPQDINFNPVWSPNGEWLSFWNSREEKIILFNQSSAETVLLDSAKGDPGCWSADGSLLYYPDLTFIQAEFRHVILKADLTQSTIETIAVGENESEWLSYDNPACHPTENLIAVFAQPNLKIPGKKVMVINPESGERETVSDDLIRIPGYLSWSPSGDSLLFQMNSFSSTQVESAVWVWDKDSGQSRQILEAVHLPAWLP